MLYYIYELWGGLGLDNKLASQDFKFWNSRCKFLEFIGKETPNEGKKEGSLIFLDLQFVIEEPKGPQYLDCGFTRSFWNFHTRCLHHWPSPSNRWNLTIVVLTKKLVISTNKDKKVILILTNEIAFYNYFSWLSLNLLKD